MKFTFSHKKNIKTTAFPKHEKKIDGWILLLVIYICLLVPVFFLSMLFFKIVSSDDYFVVAPEAETSSEILSRDKLNKALEYFKEREKKTEEILSVPLVLPDPSV